MSANCKTSTNGWCRASTTNDVPGLPAADEPDTMILCPEPNYPNRRRYVLKLHRDAAPATSGLIGRLESLTSGQVYEFFSAEELVAWLVRDLSAQADVPPSD